MNALTRKACRLLLAACCLLGCIRPPPVEAPVYVDVPPLNPVPGTFEYHGDVTFKLEERYLTEAAMASVTELTRSQTRMSVIAWDWRLDDVQAPWVRRFVKVPLEAAWILDSECAQKLAGCTEAWGRSRGDEVAIVSERIKTGFYGVVRHELGHQIGMRDHPPWVEGVMNPSHIADSWTEADVGECRRVRRCP